MNYLDKYLKYKKKYINIKGGMVIEDYTPICINLFEEIIKIKG
jgi:hypothetical protein